MGIPARRRDAANGYALNKEGNDAGAALPYIQSKSALYAQARHWPIGAIVLPNTLYYLLTVRFCPYREGMNDFIQCRCHVTVMFFRKHSEFLLGSLREN